MDALDRAFGQLFEEPQEPRPAPWAQDGLSWEEWWHARHVAMKEAMENSMELARATAGNTLRHHFFAESLK